MEALIAFFVRRPLVCNVLLVGVLVLSVFAWNRIGKEEMPEFSMDWVRVQLIYPGASAEDVELFVTKPTEESLKGVSGLYEVKSTSSRGSSSLSITFDSSSNITKKLQDVKDAIDRTDLPSEVEDPTYFQFNSAEKAIIDIAIFNQNADLLRVNERIELQEYVLSLKNQLLSLPEVSGVESNAYHQPELQIRVLPEKLKEYNISLAEIRKQILQQHIRTPVGTMTDKEESSLSLLSELNTPEHLKKVVLRSGFNGQVLRLAQVAEIRWGFAKSTSIQKVQGKEAVILNIQKSTSTDIIQAREAVVELVEEFRKTHDGSPFRFLLMDDESYDVRNRLSLIASNGIIGFIIIILLLFLFLDFRSGIWVAMGIPISLAFTIISALLIGYTVNNITLAAIIIVLGVVVDDAIIVAEDVNRRTANGLSPLKAAIKGAHGMALPILASILTTCAAFIPLYFFTGRFGLFVSYIPTVVGLMLLASFLESLFILPSHLAAPSAKDKPPTRFTVFRSKVVQKAEDGYETLLIKILKKRWIVIGGFLALLLVSSYTFTSHMNFVMFPREETSQISVKVLGPESMTKLEMAKKVSEVENIFLADETGSVTAVRTTIAQSRRGGQVRENEAFLRIELLAPSERATSSRKLIRNWEEQAKNLSGFDEIRFLKDRFGSDSGSPIAIEIQENKDSKRLTVAEDLKKALEKHPELANIEIERPIEKTEYRLAVNPEKVSQLDISFDELASSLRGYVQGHVLYTLNNNDEVVDVRLSSTDEEFGQIDRILDLYASNQGSYLVPVRNLVDLSVGKRPTSIQRTNFKRTISVYADFKPTSQMTPLEIAEHIEENIFPELKKKSPSSLFAFRGEIEDSRESQGDFVIAILMVLLLIYILLVFLYNSLTLPLIIGSIVPFGAVGVILAFIAHGMTNYGFFAVIGTLGMIGVVVNNAIIMVSRLEEGFSEKPQDLSTMGKICSTRLRPVIVTTLTTVAGLFPTAYGIGGYDSMLAEMMLALGWGLLFGTFITLMLVPCIYSFRISGVR